MKPITLWHKYNKQTKQFEYNHHENGWDHLCKPLKSLIGERWAKEFAYMDGSTVKHADKL